MPNGLPLSELASRLGGRLAGPDSTVLRVASLEDAGPGEITFFKDPKYAPRLAECRAACVLVTSEQTALRVPQIIVPDSYSAYARVAQWLHPDPSPRPGIHASAVVDPQAEVHPSAEVGPQVVIGAGVVIGPDCVIGALTCIEGPTELGPGCRIGPRVTIHANSRLGARVRIISGTVIGSEGFGYAPSPEGFIRIPQLGGVVLGDEVELGANVCVDRGALHDTVIGRGTKIDNLVHLAHNVRIGEHACLTAQVGVSGSTELGDRVLIGGQAGFVGHIRIGHGAMVGAQSGVAKSIPDGEIWSGAPARPIKALRRHEAFLLLLPKRLTALEEKINTLIEGKRNEDQTSDDPD